MPQGFKRLLHVPWAAFPQVIHDVQKATKGRQFFSSGVLSLLCGQHWALDDVAIRHASKLR
jgi:hypothetical protein